jgi:AcrR family transcriptional regulator
VFLERGFEGESVDAIADVARAGKSMIYARFPGQEALFTAVMTPHVRDIIRSFESIVPKGSTIEERLASIAIAILRKVLAAEMVGLIRAAVPKQAGFRIWRPASGGWRRSAASAAVARLLGEIAESDKLSAFAGDRRATARHLSSCSCFRC